MPQPSPRKKLKTRKCPVCARAAAENFKPFCSQRCADADLARWLKGAYAIPGKPVSEDDTAGEAEREGLPDVDPAASKPRN
jgi:uncharacterized protein